MALDPCPGVPGLLFQGMTTLGTHKTTYLMGAFPLDVVHLWEDYDMDRQARLWT